MNRLDKIEKALEDGLRTLQGEAYTILTDEPMRTGNIVAAKLDIERARKELKAYREGLESGYLIPLSKMNELEQKSFEEFLHLVKYGAKFIDIHVRKDAKEYEFEADYLKHTNTIKRES